MAVVGVVTAVRILGAVVDGPAPFTMKVLRPEILLVVMTGAANADRTYTATNTGAEGLTTIPSACLPSGTTCVQYGQLLMAVGTYNSIACATDGAGVCNCDAVSSVMRAPRSERIPSPAGR